VPPVHKTLTPYLIERQSSCLLFQKKGKKRRKEQKGKVDDIE
jgi:hypothetical protein